MSNVIVINASTPETRVAVLEAGGISDFYLERRNNKGVVGNIYKGRVLRVLPGMQASFVDIGLEKAAFLYVSDVFNDHHAVEAGDEDDDDPAAPSRKRRHNVPPIEDQLKEGQEIIVQVTKDPIGTKGARVTCHISLPGRHLVFMPTVEHLGISRQIESDKERKRLRALANEMRPKGSGFIVRTAGQGVPSESLKDDMRMLITLWNDIMGRAKKPKPPKLLHSDLDLVLRCTRDLATAELDKLIVDTREEYDRIMDFVERVMPRLARKIELYVGEEPVFDAYGIEAELAAAISNRADLPSGGYLIIEKTEALTSVDVNTGRFVGTSNLEDTIVQTNIEAADELAYQLALRSIGGLIIVDFIDMDHLRNRQKVEKAVAKAVSGDRGRVKMSRISEFGIMEMTRKRTGESFVQQLTETCECCDGAGHVKSRETMTFEVIREMRRQLAVIKEYDVRVNAHPAVVNLLGGREKESVRDLELRFNKKVTLRSDRSKRIDQFDITGLVPQKPTREPAPRAPRAPQAAATKADESAAPAAVAKAASPPSDTAPNSAAPRGAAPRGAAPRGAAAKAAEASTTPAETEQSAAPATDAGDGDASAAKPDSAHRSGKRRGGSGRSRSRRGGSGTKANGEEE
ncbi:MAG: ribonuclease G [Bradymonadia bacterium]|jgi:ribonuclease G